MGRPRLYGADYSAYVRTARLVLAEKGVDYELVPVDIFDPAGPPDWYKDFQPFGKIPAFEHDGLRLFETSAIVRFVDEAFDGPALQPADAARRAVMNQIIAIVDNYAYRAMVWDVFVERVAKPGRGQASDAARIAGGLETAAKCLDKLDRLRGENEWLAHDKPTLADFFVAAIMSFFIQTDEGKALLDQHAALADWWRRVLRTSQLCPDRTRRLKRNGKPNSRHRQVLVHLPRRQWPRDGGLCSVHVGRGRTPELTC